MKKLPVENKESGRNGPYYEPFCECKTPFEFSFEITPITGCSGFADKYLKIINKLLAGGAYWNNLHAIDKLIFGLRSWLSCLEKRKSEMMRGKWKKLEK